MNTAQKTEKWPDKEKFVKELGLNCRKWHNKGSIHGH